MWSPGNFAGHNHHCIHRTTTTTSIAQFVAQSAAIPLQCTSHLSNFFDKIQHRAFSSDKLCLEYHIHAPNASRYYFYIFQLHFSYWLICGGEVSKHILFHKECTFISMMEYSIRLYIDLYIFMMDKKLKL